MNRLVTNFALLMEFLNISSKEISIDLQVSPSLISRWRGGSRRLIENGLWPRKLARYFVQRNYAEVKELLLAVCPLETAMDADLTEILAKWLCKLRNEDRNALLPSPCLDAVAHCSRTRCVEGDESVRSILCEFLDYAITLPYPGDILFACPDGLSIFTRDSEYNLPLQAQLWKVFERGFRLKAVLRTDYRASDVALACGPWLAAHLRGFIQSYYYDDFCVNREEEMLICLPGHLAIRTIVGAERPKAQILKDKKGVNEAQERFQAYLNKAERRFHYGFLDAPEGFLSDVRLYSDKPAFFFQRLPHFGLLEEEEMGLLFGLSETEQAMLRKEFAPLLVTPSGHDADVYFLMDAGAVDRALDQERHLCRELSRIFGRRIYLSTRNFSSLLLSARHLLEKCSNYHLLCLPSNCFDRFGMELVVCGNEAAVAWLGSGQSAACNDYPNVSALQGFCATQFKQLSTQFRQNASAKLDIWLRRAGKMGLLHEK